MSDVSNSVAVRLHHGQNGFRPVLASTTEAEAHAEDTRDAALRRWTQERLAEFHARLAALQDHQEVP